ncbi:MAG: thiolase family protein [Acetobacteraceae bacterium]
MTLNRFCASGLEAIAVAAAKVTTRQATLVVAGGVESMSRVQMLGFNPVLNPRLQRERPDSYISMGLTAENLAERYQIDRAAQQRFAVTSQQRAAAAQQEGRFADEIVPIRTPAGVVDQDGCIRAETSEDGLATLKPAFLATGTVTAGTSSPLTDGAAAVLVASADYAARHGLPVLARITGMAVAGCAPDIMGIGPVPATRKAMARAGLEMTAVDLVELNEAFAAQAMAVERDLMLDHAQVNLDGGAIALGHPLGASGARITGKAAALLGRSGGRHALATMCVGGGQGVATVLSRA